MNKAHLPLVLSKDEWLEQARKLFPHATERQREQMWEECQQTKPMENFYERHSNKGRYT